MVTNTLAIDLRCWKCYGHHENVEDREEKLHEYLKTVTYLSYLGVKICSGGG